MKVARFLRIALLAFIAVFGSMAYADSPDLDLLIWNRTTVDTEKDSEFEDTRTNHFEIKAAYAPESTPLKIGIEIDSFYASNSAAEDMQETEFRLYDTYVKLNSESGDFRIGYQIVRWGKTDEISPFDIITAEDFRDGFVRPRAERKLGTPMMVLNHAFENSELQLISKPVFMPDEYDFSDSDWAIAGNRRGGKQLGFDEKTPDFSLGNMSFGARYSSKISSFDYSLNAYSGPSSSPTILTKRTPGIQSQYLPTDFKAEYRRVNFVGAELEREISSSVFRADLMFSMNEYMTDSSFEISKSDIIKSVIGLENIFDNDLHFNIQFVEYYRLEDDESGLPNNMEGLFTYLNYPLIENELKIGARSFLLLRNNSSYLNLYCIFHDRGSWNIESGVDLMFGNFILFNQFAGNNDQGYLVFKYRL